MGNGKSGVPNKSGYTAMENIKTFLLQHGENSKFAGVRRDAMNGTGAYGFKDAQPVDSQTALNMKTIIFMERDGKTLAHGFIGDNYVYYADNSNSNIIEQLKKKSQDEKNKNVVQSQSTQVDITPTSTYNRWKKQHDKKFAAWFGNR